MLASSGLAVLAKKRTAFVMLNFNFIVVQIFTRPISSPQAQTFRSYRKLFIFIKYAKVYYRHSRFSLTALIFHRSGTKINLVDKTSRRKGWERTGFSENIISISMGNISNISWNVQIFSPNGRWVPSLRPTLYLPNLTKNDILRFKKLFLLFQFKNSKRRKVRRSSKCVNLQLIT